MKIPFRQGLVRVPTSTFLVLEGTNKVSLVIGPGETLVAAYADGANDYLTTHRVSLNNAWAGPFTGGDYWLYIDINMTSGATTFGHTTVSPKDGSVAPVTPVVDQHWFDSTSHTMKVWNGANWARKVRVMVARLSSNAFSSVSINAPTFTGTQVGDTSSVLAGSLTFDVNGQPIKKGNNSFFTTEDMAVTGVSSSSRVKFGSLIVEAEAEANLASYTMVQFTGFNKINAATNYLIDNGPYGIIESGATSGDIVGVTMDGLITNPAWDWTSAGVNALLYVNGSGALTTTPSPAPIVVAAVVDKTTVLLRPSSLFSNTTNDGATTSTIGGVLLSVAPALIGQPIAVGINDPAYTGAAPLASPTFTGTPAAPTATSGTNTTQLATTAFVTTAVAPSELLANKATTFATINDTLYPSVQAVKNYADSLVVGLWDDRGNFDASINTYPATGGSGTAGAILKGDAWTISAIATSGVLLGHPIGSTVRALVDAPAQLVANWSVLDVGVGYVPAPTDSAALTGIPTAPTAAPGTNTTQLATTAFVTSAVSPSELVANKATTFATVNDTLYPSVQAVKTYADGNVVGLWDDRGAFDASINTYPATGGSGTAGAILKGDVWTIGVIATSGVLLGHPVGSVVRALIDAPAQLAANWNVLDAGVGYVPAPTDSAALTGIPTAPTAAVHTDTTQLATTAFVLTEVTNARYLDLGTVSSGTATLNYSVAVHQRVQNGGVFTIATSNWPTTGNSGQMMFELVNGAAFAITWPTINWIKTDGTTTTSFAANGVTLQAAGTDFVMLWTRDGGTTIYGKVVR